MNGAVVAVIEGGSVYLTRTDHIDRPVFATNGSGSVVWEASYLPFGGVHTSTGSNINLRFPGQWFQSEAALHQNWMRDYDPTTGRYIQADPLGLVDGASVYGYALQNPGRYTDPRGEQSGPKGTTKVPGTGYNVRIDKPTQPNQKTHAHIYDRKMCQQCVVNDDGSPSHGSSKNKIRKILKNKKLRRFLTEKGFKFSNISPLGLLEYCIPSIEEMNKQNRCMQNPLLCSLDLDT